MREGSLCSGYNGLGMAVEEVFGAAPAWFCEYDDAPSKILSHHWPTVPNYRDLTAVDWSTVEPVEIVTAGYPCQPFSAAGQRKGTSDERHLWPFIREAVRVLRPRFVVLENVAGHRSLGFDRVLGDLAEDGFHVRWTSVRASDVGAPHHRERLFVLAYPGGAAVGKFAGGPSSEEARPVAGDGLGDHCGERADRVGRETATDSESLGRGMGHAENVGPADREIDPLGNSGDAVANPNGVGCGQGSGQSVAGEPELAAHLGGERVLPDTGSEKRPCRTGLRTHEPEGIRRPRPRDGRNDSVEWGPYAPAIRRAERAFGRPAPSPTELNSNGKPRLNAAFAEWMMSLPEGHVTDPAIGLPRTAQLKAIGNGVAPLQAVYALRQLLAMEVAA